MTPRQLLAVALVSFSLPIGVGTATALGVRAHSVAHPVARVVDWSKPVTNR